MKVVVIDCGAGNLRSVTKSLQRVAGENASAINITTDANELASATHIVLPGVGAFADCMSGLLALPNMKDALEEEALKKKKPFLGICVGMQMLMQRSHEHGVHKGLGWFDGEVLPIPRTSAELKIPHMGWNELQLTQQHPVFDGIRNGDHAYFVHSYFVQCTSPETVMAQVAYGNLLTAMLGRGNIIGTQFHPEKSQGTGLRLLFNFLKM